MRKVIYIFPPIFGLFLDLTNPPFYPIIVASVIAVIFYLYKNKEGEKLEERKRATRTRATRTRATRTRATRTNDSN